MSPAATNSNWDSDWNRTTGLTTQAEQYYDVVGRTWPFSLVYSIIIEEASSGTASADKARAAEGEAITLTITPADGCELETLSVENGETTVSISENNTYTIPAGDVTISAAFLGACPHHSPNTATCTVKFKCDTRHPQRGAMAPRDIGNRNKIYNVRDFGYLQKGMFETFRHMVFRDIWQMMEANYGNPIAYFSKCAILKLLYSVIFSQCTLNIIQRSK